ncbi:MAG: LytTR family DNA-binding domain-containing protein [Lachnospiraceae bacterium]|nr:LytTR family DNA-binding domain-containing protein [Lachnospiraceae bacterium]
MLTICICDDDQSVASELGEKIRMFMEKHQRDYRILTYTEGNKLLQQLSERPAGWIYLLDIVMPGVSGMEIARQIRGFDETAAILFLTSSTEYAVESYEVWASAYLIKPIKTKCLEEALLRLPMMKQPVPLSGLLLRERGIHKSVSYDSICCLESRRNKICISQNSGEHLEIYSTMQEMEQKLKGHSEFVRTHRSYMVNLRYIREISSEEIILSFGERIPLSKKYVSSVKTAYFHYVEDLFHNTKGGDGCHSI